MSQQSLRLAQVLWPAFLMAGVLEMVVFSVLDPSALSFGEWHPAPVTIYSLAFFVFWALIAVAAAASQWMSRPTSSDAPEAGHAAQTRRRRARHGTAQHV